LWSIVARVKRALCVCVFLLLAPRNVWTGGGARACVRDGAPQQRRLLFGLASCGVAASDDVRCFDRYAAPASVARCCARSACLGVPRAGSAFIAAAVRCMRRLVAFFVVSNRPMHCFVDRCHDVWPIVRSACCCVDAFLSRMAFVACCGRTRALALARSDSRAATHSLENLTLFTPIHLFN
jgi:hypothetical protein